MEEEEIKGSDNQEKISVPQAYYCPLTLELMRDPVIDHEGNSYERSAIMEWLQKSQFSPITRQPLSVHDLHPNRALKDSIDLIIAEIQPQQLKTTNAMIKPFENQNQKQASNQNSQQQLQQTLQICNFSNLVKISFNPGQGDILTFQRHPADIVCVVDTSGSMGSEASIKNAKGVNEGYGLSVLDVVKHAVKTIIHNLMQSDRLSIVEYNWSGKVVLPLTNMDKQGMEIAEKQLCSLEADGSTNLWDGLLQGMNVLDDNSEGRIQTVLLFTDGMPNVEPPRGHVPMLKKYMEEHPHAQFSVNTFGFGYEMDSKLLDDLASEGNGSYAFIPDCSFVGTIFVNAVSNFLSTFGQNSSFNIEPLHGASIRRIFGGFKEVLSSSSTTGTVLLSTGPLFYGQTKDIVLELDNYKNGMCALKVTLQFQDPATKKLTTIINDDMLMESDNHVKHEQHVSIECDMWRLQMVDEVRRALRTAKDNNQLEQAFNGLNLFIKQVQSSISSSHPFVVDLLKDLKGQCVIALSKQEYFDKWGFHFLPSLLRAHQMQQCNNFKDPGVQHYGGALFKKLRDMADETFNKIPPPQPLQYAQGGGMRSNPVNMAQFNNSNNVCFEGSCRVMAADGQTVLVRDIKKGDLVATCITPFEEKLKKLNASTMTISYARVLCVVKTELPNKSAELVRINDDLLITPWHPIFYSAKWVFPSKVGSLQRLHCDAVYNFVLERDHVMFIGGVPCVTLGHMLRDAACNQQKIQNVEKEAILSHDFFGTEKVIRDLEQKNGWSEGLVVLKEGCLIKGQNGLVSALHQ